ncbi:hypothetical protein IIC65_08435, partial [Candidatus Sumerlaeota bacterium]|nr:hypothetical protein [Candidatus Sumerlaeota bacterium]
MKHRMHETTNRSRRGSLLFMAVTIMFLASIGGILIFQSLLEHSRQNISKRDITRSTDASGSGVQMVIDWGNRPATFDPDDDLFEREDVFDGGEDIDFIIAVLADLENLFPELADELDPDGFDVTKDQMDAMGLGTFITGHGDLMAEITELELLPADGTAGLPAHTFRVRCVAITPG